MSHCMSHGAIHQPLRERPSRRRSARRAAWLAVATLVDVGRSWGARRARGLRQHAADGAFTRVPLVRRALPSRRSGTEGARSRADDLTSRALQSREWAICFAPLRDLGPLTAALAPGPLSPSPPAIRSRASLSRRTRYTAAWVAPRRAPPESPGGANCIAHSRDRSAAELRSRKGPARALHPGGTSNRLAR